MFYQRIGALKRAQLHHRVADSVGRKRGHGIMVTPAELASHYELSHDLQMALPHYAEAAESALRRFAPAEGTAYAEHGLELIPRLPPGPMRDGLELTLSAMKGVATAQLRGVSSLEAKRAFERAKALLDLQPRHPVRGMVLHALGLVLMTRGEYTESEALGQHMHALAEAENDPALLLSTCSLLGQRNAIQGNHREACEWLERGIGTCEALGDASLQAAFVVDPGVTMHSALAIPLLHRGLPDQARARIGIARERARRLGQPMGHMVALWFNCMLEARMQNVTMVASLAAELSKVVEDGALAQGKAPSRWFRGWAEALLGSPLNGHQLIMDAYERNTRLGMFAGSGEVLYYAAEAMLLAGDLAAAETHLEAATQLARRLSERVYLTQILTLQARIAHARNDERGMRAALRDALTEARRQQSPWLELNVLVALHDVGQAQATDTAALAEVYRGFSEGHDLPVYAKARSALRPH